MFFLIIDSIEDVISEIFVSEVEKMTFPLLRYVLTSWKGSSSKHSFNFCIDILFFPLILIPRNKAIYRTIEKSFQSLYFMSNNNGIVTRVD